MRYNLYVLPAEGLTKHNRNVAAENNHRRTSGESQQPTAVSRSDRIVDEIDSLHCGNIHRLDRGYREDDVNG